MDYYLLITADYNDGDYDMRKSLLNSADIPIINKVVKVLSENQESPNWETGELCDDRTPELLYVETGLLTQEDVDIFNEFVPNGDPNYSGIHTIESIEVITIIDKLL